ncbi:unnamed protein product, partial [Ascophyllum nodosum]
GGCCDCCTNVAPPDKALAVELTCAFLRLRGSEALIILNIQRKRGTLHRGTMMALITRANARLLLLFLLVVKTTFATGSSKIAVAGAESASKPDGDVTIRHKKFGARDFLEFGVVKRRIDPELSLDDWQEFGFAFPDRREAEFEALRVDKVLTMNDLPHYHIRGVTPYTFMRSLEPKSEPFIVEGIMEKDNWEAAEWTIPLLAEKYPLMQVKVGADSDNSPIQMNMADFARYARTQKDDRPMYVFDEEVYNDPIGRHVMKQYKVPGMFPEDLFKYVKGHPKYPAHRWLLIGPKRSGSAVHSDPLATSAWNTLISGRKLWFIAPPYMEDVVMPTRDKVVSRWFIEEMPKLRAKYEDEIGIYVQHPGETIFVPSFWVHAVLNIDDTVAVTQNFVTSHTFVDSWQMTWAFSQEFAQKWLQQLVVHHEDLALLALRLNERNRLEDEAA